MKFLKYLLVLGLPLSAVLVWFVDKSLNQFIFFPENLFSYILQISGLVALALLTLNFILSVKNKKSEAIMGGLDKQYKIHSWVGRTAFAIITIHILVGILRSPISPETLRIYLLPGDNLIYNFGIIAFWLLTFLIILTVLIKLPYNIWKFTHRLMIIPFLLAAIHAYLNAYSRNLIPITSSYVILLTIIGASAYIYVEFLFARFGPVFKYKVLSVATKGNVAELFLESIGNKIDFIPGQYIFLSFIKNKKISHELHPFAISVAPSEPTRVSAKMLGDYTNSLTQVVEGDRVNVIGPFGQFNINRYKSEEVVVWIAGGIGITPFLSMLRAESASQQKKKFYFFYCVKNSQEAVYSEEIQRYKLENMKIFHHFSDESGFVNGEYLRQQIGEDFSKALFMICGPTPMMKGLNKNLKKMNINSKKILFENYSFR